MFSEVERKYSMLEETEIFKGMSCSSPIVLYIIREHNLELAVWVGFFVSQEGRWRRCNGFSLMFYSFALALREVLFLLTDCYILFTGKV